jgi:hypothetical protein
MRLIELAGLTILAFCLLSLLFGAVVLWLSLRLERKDRCPDTIPEWCMELRQEREARAGLYGHMRHDVGSWRG